MCFMGSELMRTPMENTLKEYRGTTDISIYSIFWTGLMALFGCCGIEGIEDFKKTDSWRIKSLRNYKIDINLKGMLPKPPNNMAQPPLTVNTNLNILKNLPQSIKNTCSLVDLDGEIHLHCELLDSSKWKTPMVCC